MCAGTGDAIGDVPSAADGAGKYLDCAPIERVVLRHKSRPLGQRWLSAELSGRQELRS